MTNPEKSRIDNIPTDYWLAILTKGIEGDLAQIKVKVMEKAQKEFENEVDELLKTTIYRIVKNLQVKYAHPMDRMRPEIVVQLPILKTLGENDD